MPVLSKKLGDIGIRNFEELYRFEVQKELNLAQENKFFNGRSGNRNAVSSSSIIQVNSIRQLSNSLLFNPFRQPSNSVQINAIRQPPWRFSNLGQPLSKILEKLIEKNLLWPIPSQQPSLNANPKLYYKFHQTIGHDTDSCIRLRHEIQDLIDAGKITDIETKKPNTQNNPLPNY